MKLIRRIFWGIIVVVLVWFGTFYWQNLRGVGPAILPPAGDIAHQIMIGENPLTLPVDFEISVYFEGLGKPRVLAYGPRGEIFVSLIDQGKVVALPDRNFDGKADKQVIVASGLRKPHGIIVDCNLADPDCSIYIAEEHRVAVWDLDKETLKASNPQKLFDLPTGGNHFTRTIMWTPEPEPRLLVGVGSSCNVCLEEDSRRASILVYDFQTNQVGHFARGLRNAVFMTTHPVIGQIWATEMGRDLLGDDLPPDEINIVREDGNYGWPWCFGKNVYDNDFQPDRFIFESLRPPPCVEPYDLPSHIDIPAHSAPLGLAFIPAAIGEPRPNGREEGWPEEYWYDLLVAYHGSWNRTEPTGYKIVRFDLDETGNHLGVEDFITGWLDENGEAWGRPADILVSPGGLAFISDDKAGVIYRLTYEGPAE